MRQLTPEEISSLLASPKKVNTKTLTLREMLTGFLKSDAIAVEFTASELGYEEDGIPVGGSRQVLTELLKTNKMPLRVFYKVKSESKQRADTIRLIKTEKVKK